MTTDNDYLRASESSYAETYPRSRRPKYTPQRMERICASLEAGESLRTAASAEGVDKASVYRWCRANAAVAEQFNRSYELGLHRWQDRLLEICEELQDAAEDTRHGAQRVAALKLEADSIKWTLSHRTRRAGKTVQDDAGGEIDKLLADQQRENYAHRNDSAEFLRFVKSYAREQGWL